MVEYSDGRLFHHKFLFFRHLSDYSTLLIGCQIIPPLSGIFQHFKLNFALFTRAHIGLSPFYSRQGTHATNDLHEIQYADFSSAYNSANYTSKSLFILAYFIGIFHISSEYSRFNRNIPHYSVFVAIFHNFHMSEYSIFRRNKENVVSV